MNESQPTNYSDPLPASAQIIFLLLAVVLGMFLGQLFGLGIAHLSGLGDAISTPGWTPENGFERTIYRAVALIGHLFTFLVPALVFARLRLGQSWKTYMQIDRRPLAWQLFHGSFWIIVAFPVAQYLYLLNQGIPLPEWAHFLEQSTNGLIEALLVMDTPFELLFTLIVMAVAPAIGEEFIFRGLIQRIIQVKSGKPHLAILVAAVIFSAFHFQFEGFFPRLMLGLMLGYLFFWTRSIWVPVVVHFVYNGLQVVAAYFSPEMLEEAGEKPDLIVEPYTLVLSLILTFVIGFFIYARSNRNDNLAAQ